MANLPAEKRLQINHNMVQGLKNRLEARLKDALADSAKPFTDNAPIFHFGRAEALKGLIWELDELLKEW